MKNREKTYTRELSAELMTLAPDQGYPGSPWRPTSVGGASYCRDVRTLADGMLGCEQQPTEVVSTLYPVCAVDPRGEMTNILTLDPRGDLRHEASLGADGNVAAFPDAPVLGRIAPGRVQTAKSGDFLTLLDADGDINHLLWRADRECYLWLGKMPGPPKLNVKASNPVTFAGVVKAMSFRETVADMRSAVPDEVTEQVADAVRDATVALEAQAAASSYFTTPVYVRLAARLWDGTLLHLSAPRLVAPVDFCQNRRVALPLVGDAEGVTGTAVVPISMRAYRLDVDIEWDDADPWGNLVRSFEVWVSPAPELRRAGGSVEVTCSSAGTSLVAADAFRTEGELHEEALASWMERCCTSVSTSGVNLLLGRGPKGLSAVWADPRAERLTGARAVCGNGGFLHLGGVSFGTDPAALPTGMPGATQTATCRIVARLSLPTGAATAVAEGSVVADDGVLAPLIWYPDSRAVKVTVSLDYGDGRLYEDTFDLTQSRSGEDAAYFRADSPIALPDVLRLTEASSDVSGESLPDSVCTMAKGNPFVPASMSRETGGRVEALVAQYGRGGAFTRQYIYVCTDEGIVALTHDTTGRHCTCRPLSRRRVADSARAASSEEGVFMLTDDGALLHLRDARVDSLLRRLPIYPFLAVAPDSGRLWLVAAPPRTGRPPLESLVVDLSSDSIVRASMSSLVASSVFPANSGLLFGARDTSVYMVATSGTSAPAPGMWVSPTVELPPSSLVSAECDAVPASGETLGMEVRLLPPALYPAMRYPGPDSGETVCSLRGPDEGEALQCCFLSPARLRGVRSTDMARIVLEGRFASFRGAAIKKIANS